jgi:hypothetical protein
MLIPPASFTVTNEKRWNVFMKKAIFMLSLIGIGAIAQGCLQQDQGTVGDQAQQEADRENQVANAMAGQYGQVTGQYIGTYHESTLVLELDVVRESTDSSGGDSPKAILQGGLSFVPAIHVKTVTGEPMKIPFPVTDGQYVNGNDLSLTIQQNGNPTFAHCKVVDSDSDLDCEWFVDASTVTSAHFVLHRVSDAQQVLASVASQSQGEYTGSDSLHSSIVAIFETKEDVSAGSISIPQVTIGGTIAFDNVVYSFKGGEYDPINNTLALDIQGTNPITVNCAVMSADKLRCVWSGKNGNGTQGDDGQDEVFDLTMSSAS